jgi:hypothetical protein
MDQKCDGQIRAMQAAEELFDLVRLLMGAGMDLGEIEHDLGRRAAGDGTLLNHVEGAVKQWHRYRDTGYSPPPSATSETSPGSPKADHCEQ